MLRNTTFSVSDVKTYSWAKHPQSIHWSRNFAQLNA